MQVPLSQVDVAGFHSEASRLLAQRVPPDTVQWSAYPAQAVRRDIHKMKTRLVLRALPIGGEPVQVAWYEPAHYVCEAVAGWLARREPAARWVLLTPDRSMRWDGQKLLSAPGVAPLQEYPGAVLSDEVLARVLEALPWLQQSG